MNFIGWADLEFRLERTFGFFMNEDRYLGDHLDPDMHTGEEGDAFIQDGRMTLE